ncbi:MAG: helix-turn-helix transcriptional regulator [Ligilactobacillus animalis]|uniref:helix-turn-helix domain-containing protein n=1 Tax=Ligilactobacillus animalis TaxID=1605 RepID=UPI00242DDF1B|nr:helix-turn-helix transcriptional regulator [Ligilactobacillus animalis]MCI5942948.1 helix-turn-helix transcriptional regulator [Ligilactobacillus animalis]MDY2993782.1 helix-turn-helix transcriptional regulator [Ligilactobacillus animalis]
MFNIRLKELRNQKNMTQDELGKVLNVSGKTIGTWERDSRQPNIETINALANYFNVSTDYLLGRKEDSKTANDDKQVDLTGIGQKEDGEKIFSYEGKEIPKQDLELIRRILETGEYSE